MFVQPDSIEDPRLAPYRNLKDRELARLGGRFIAESDLIVRRLLASGYETESVLVASRKAEALKDVVPPRVPLYVLPEEMLDAVIGYPFHTGVLAVGLRKQSPGMESFLSERFSPSPGTPGEGRGEGDFERRTDSAISNDPHPNPLPEYREREQVKSILVILPEITNAENMGSLIRISSAFGADAIILGPRCCDPFYRMSIRVSMGTIFSIPILRSEDLAVDSSILKQREYELVATVLDCDAEVLDQATRPDRLAILFGNEATGLTAADIAMCDRRVTLPMKLGTDSLNVAVAAGIFLYHFTG